MKKILNEKKEILFIGKNKEMQLAFEYLTIPFYLFAEKNHLKMSDGYYLNNKYWNEKTKNAKKFTLVSA